MYLGRTVVARDDVGRHHEGGAGRARQPEVQDLQRAVALHHYIGRLQVLSQTDNIKALLKSF